MQITIPSKDIEETATLLFDFSDQIYVDPIVSAKVVIDVKTGEDYNPSIVLNGAPTFTMSTVSQQVSGGEKYTAYRIRCTATTSLGRVYVQWGYLCISSYIAPYSFIYTGEA